RHTRFSRDWSSDVCSSDLGIRQIDDVSINFELVGRSLAIFTRARFLLRLKNRLEPLYLQALLRIKPGSLVHLVRIAMLVGYDPGVSHLVIHGMVGMAKKPEFRLIFLNQV